MLAFKDRAFSVALSPSPAYIFESLVQDRVLLLPGVIVILCFFHPSIMTLTCALKVTEFSASPSSWHKDFCFVFGVGVGC